LQTFIASMTVIKFSWRSDQFFQRYERKCENVPSRKVWVKSFKNRSIQIRKRMASKVSLVLPYPLSSEIFIGSFYAMLLTDRQTDRQRDKRRVKHNLCGRK